MEGLLLIRIGPGFKVLTDEDKQCIKDLTSQDLDAGTLIYEPEVLQLIPYIGKPLKAVSSRVREFYVSDLPQPDDCVFQAYAVEIAGSESGAGRFPVLLKISDQCSRIRRTLSSTSTAECRCRTAYFRSRAVGSSRRCSAALFK